jgi:hypothetical protein
MGTDSAFVLTVDDRPSFTAEVAEQRGKLRRPTDRSEMFELADQSGLVGI